MLTVRDATVKCHRSKWQILAIDFLRPCERHDSAPLAARSLEENFAAQNFNRVPADAHVNYPVIAARGPHKNPAGPVHLDALFNKHSFVGFGYAVRHHPSRGAAGG